MEDFLNNDKKINIKKIAIILSIILAIFLISTILILAFKEDKKPTQAIIAEKEEVEASSNPNASFVSLDETFIIELPKELNFKQYKSTRNYLLELRNEEKNFSVYISKFNIDTKRPIEDILKLEQDEFVKNFRYYSNLSTIKQIENTNYPDTYTYSLQYLDSKENITYYLQVIWIKINQTIYTLDFDFPQEKVTEYSSLITTILNNLKIK